MEKTLKFKKDYAIVINGLSDKDAGRFIKVLSNYYFDDKEEDIKDNKLSMYFSLIKDTLDEEKTIDEEAILQSELDLNKESMDTLRKMFGDTQSISDLIDYEISKMFLRKKESVNEGS